MGKKTGKGINFQNKTVNNTNESAIDKNRMDNSLALNTNVDEANNRPQNKKMLSEASGSLPRLRPRINSSNCCASTSAMERNHSSSSAELESNQEKSITRCTGTTGTAEEVDDLKKDSNVGLVTKQNIEERFDDKIYESTIQKRTGSTSIAMDKIKLDITIDPTVVDRYTDQGFSEEEATPESPETRRQRIDIISRQCRLHPSNEKYNQGPVENPPPITPGTMVGYTPGGQRHEVDLNFGRPSSFNSEYARMQWDYATRINVSRMFDQLETGTFLPNGLDPSIERRYFAEQEMITDQATKHFKILQQIVYCLSRPASGQPGSLDLTEEEKEHLLLLQTEEKFLELNQYAVVRISDFAKETDQQLRKALDLPLTPLMIKKNPFVVDTLEMLATQCFHMEVVLSARALLDKIKGLFEVPYDKDFIGFFVEEVEKLKEKTKHMTSIDIFTMTKEPPEEPDDLMSRAHNIESRLSPLFPDVLMDGAHNVESSCSSPDTSENETASLPEDAWVPVEDDDVWIDTLPDSENDSVVDDNSVISSTASTPSLRSMSEDSNSDEEEVVNRSMQEDSNSDEETENEIDYHPTLVSEE